MKLLLAFFAFLSICAPKSIAQPGGGGGLILKQIYPPALSPFHITTQTNTISVRAWELKDSSKGGKIGQNLLVENPEMRRKYDFFPKENIALYLPPHYWDTKHHEKRCPNQRLELACNGDTMLVDFFGIVSENGAGHSQIMECIQFVGGAHVQVFFKIPENNPLAHQHQASLQQGLTHAVIQNLQVIPSTKDYQPFKLYGKIRITPPKQIAYECNEAARHYNFNQLCPANIDTHSSKKININTQTPATKTDKFDTYIFYWRGWALTQNNGLLEGEENANPILFDTTGLRKKLFCINGKPFTGYFKIATNFYDQFAMHGQNSGTSLATYQFDKGVFETLTIDYDVWIDQNGVPSGRVRPAKPVLYLYPTQTTNISVKIKLTTHEFTHTYPTYPKATGWSVQAQPNGDLKDPKTGRNYYCLFWETKGSPLLQSWTQGNVVKGSETAEFLEKTLAQLGLNEREANEFIIYWLPQMENNPFNAIYFATHEYEKTSQLEIQPQPDQTIRVMMVWKPLQAPIQLQPQILPKMPARKGFVAVEWGGVKEE